MKLLGFGLLLAGWFISVVAVALLKNEGPRIAFVLAGVGVEVLGLVFAVRGHLSSQEDEA
jgi:hypothetical protein